MKKTNKKIIFKSSKHLVLWMFVVVFVSAISHHLLVENVHVFAINLSLPGNFLPVCSLFFLFSTHLVVFPLFGAFNILFIYFKITVSNVNYRHPGTRALD